MEWISLGLNSGSVHTTLSERGVNKKISVLYSMYTITWYGGALLQSGYIVSSLTKEARALALLLWLRGQTVSCLNEDVWVGLLTSRVECSCPTRHCGFSFFLSKDMHVQLNWSIPYDKNVSVRIENHVRSIATEIIFAKHYDELDKVKVRTEPATECIVSSQFTPDFALLTSCCHYV